VRINGGGRIPWITAILAILAILATTTSVAAQDRPASVTVRSREELQQALAEARPGTKILIAPGTYEGGLSAANLRGTKELPITIGGADRVSPPVISGGNSCLHLSDPAFLELHDLVLTKGWANGLNIDDADSQETAAEQITLRGITVRDIGTDKNHDGIKLSGLADFRIERCTVERWGKRGSGIDMVGCRRGVVTHSTFRDGDPIGANGVQMKGGSRDITVRYCRFENAGGRAVNLGGSTGLPYFRPAATDHEAKDLIVEDCTFIGSMAQVAFVGVDGTTVRHNTFYRPTRWLLRILQENQGANFLTCRNGTFTKNIVVFRSDELSAVLNIGPKTSPETFRFADNLWYCLDTPDSTRRRIQLPTDETGGVYDRAPAFRDAEKHDLELVAESPASGFGPRVDKTP